MPRILAIKQVKKALRGEAVVIVQYCNGLHWFNLAIIGPERNVYHWDPFGKKLEGRHPIRSAFESATAAQGWQFTSLPIKLQADGHSCGDWAHYFRSRVLAYVADDAARDFASFLADGMTNLLLPRRNSPELRQAEQRQRHIARERRDALRTLLRRAYRLDALPFGARSIDAKGRALSTVNFIDLDEELAGLTWDDPMLLSDDDDDDDDDDDGGGGCVVKLHSEQYVAEDTETHFARIEARSAATLMQVLQSASAQLTSHGLLTVESRRLRIYDATPMTEEELLAARAAAAKEGEASLFHDPKHIHYAMRGEPLPLALRLQELDRYTIHLYVTEACSGSDE